MASGLSSEKGLRNWPLDRAREQIRLVRLLPDEAEAPVRLEMTVVGLDEAPPFYCVSWVIDFDHEGQNFVFCDGIELKEWPATVQLLKYLRTKPLSLPLPDLIWMRELCGYQEPPYIPSKERIYARASHLVCWIPLYPPSATITLLSELGNVARMFSKLTGFQTGQSVMYRGRYITPKDLRTYRSLVSQLQIEPEAWAGLHLILSHSFIYWMSVQTELISSKFPILLTFSGSVPWHVFSAGLDTCLLHLTQAIHVPAKVLNLVVINTLTDNWSNMYELGITFPRLILEDLQCHWGSSTFSTLTSAMDLADWANQAQREKFFLLSSGRRGLELSVALARYINYASGSFVSLSISYHIIGENSLPSWVPDLAKHEPLLLNCTSNDFAASSTRSWSQPDINRLDEGMWHDPILTACGEIIDTIDEVYEYLPPRRLSHTYTLADNDNIWSFVQWHRAMPLPTAHRELRNGVILDLERSKLLTFAETIHANGCNHLWQMRHAMDDEKYIECAAKFLEFIQDESEPSIITDDLYIFYAATLPAHGRRFGISSKGHSCLLPKGTASGDRVVVLDGNKVPVILREDCDFYRNIGESYIHGAMFGESDSWSEVERKEIIIK